MKALFVGQGYLDLVFLSDYMPSGDEKYVAQNYAASFGGNAVSAAFACAKLGISPDLIMQVADDVLGGIIPEMASKANICLHPRKVAKSSVTFILSNEGQRAILRSRDTDYLEPFPKLELDGCEVLHLDGHQPDAALHYAKLAREKGILTSLDGGSYEREGIKELLKYIDVAVVCDRFCDQMGLHFHDALKALRDIGVKLPAVTRGEQGILFLERGQFYEMPAISVPAEKVIDTNGAGDIFHGAYVFSYLRDKNEKSWAEHFSFARAASTLAIQELGNEASLPELAAVEELLKQYPADAQEVNRAA